MKTLILISIVISSCGIPNRCYTEGDVVICEFSDRIQVTSDSLMTVYYFKTGKIDTIYKK